MRRSIERTVMVVMLCGCAIVAGSAAPSPARAQEARVAVAVNAPAELQAALLTALRASVEGAGATVIPDSELAAARAVLLGEGAALDAQAAAGLARELALQALWLLDARPLDEGGLALSVQRISPSGAIVRRFASVPTAFEGALGALIAEIAAEPAAAPTSAPAAPMPAAPTPAASTPAAPTPAAPTPAAPAPAAPTPAAPAVTAQAVAPVGPFAATQVQLAQPASAPARSGGGASPMWGLFVPGAIVFVVFYVATPLITLGVCGGGPLCNPGVVDSSWIPFAGGILAAELERDPIWYATALGTGIASLVLQAAGMTMTILGLSIWRRRGGPGRARAAAPDLRLGFAPNVGGGTLTGTLTF